jgi:hypothetical protein
MVLKEEVDRLEDPIYRDILATNAQLTRALTQERARTPQLVAAIYAAAKDAAGTKHPLPPVPRRKKSRLAPEVALLHTTDWQVGKRTASYNSDVADRRLSVEMMDTVDKITEMHRSAVPVDECTLLLGGDMIEGVMIFPGQAHAIDTGLLEQVFRVADILERMILRLLTTFQTVTIVEEKGNHGRIGTKRDPVPSLDNLDLMAYRIAAQRFDREPRVVWPRLPDPGIFHLFTIGNYRGLLFHGDEIKGAFGNLPQFAIHRRLTSWRASYEFHDAYGGHYHTPYTLVLPNGGFGFGTGSPESDNDFATEYMGAVSRPSQRLHFVHPEKAIVTSQHVLHFDYAAQTA